MRKKVAIPGHNLRHSLISVTYWQCEQVSYKLLTPWNMFITLTSRRYATQFNLDFFPFSLAPTTHSQTTHERGHLIWSCNRDSVDLSFFALSSPQSIFFFTKVSTRSATCNIFTHIYTYLFIVSLRHGFI
jgi:hypothetical protein